MFLLTGWKSQVVELQKSWTFDGQPGSNKWAILAAARDVMQAAMGTIHEKAEVGPRCPACRCHSCSLGAHLPPPCPERCLPCRPQRKRREDEARRNKDKEVREKILLEIEDDKLDRKIRQELQVRLYGLV